MIEKPKNRYALVLLKMFETSTKIVKFEPLYSVDFLNKETNNSLMQQIKQRHLNEKLNFFNAGFNHLLNEFQNIVEAAYFDGKKVKSNQIRDKLIDEKYKVKEILLVSDFFKRRNQNSISHSNDPELGFWGVSENEYEEYKKRLNH